MTNNYSHISRMKVMMTLSVAWERTVASKQTLFPVWGEREDRKPRKGVPEDDNEYTLRATKGVNMHPFPKILITKEDGSNHMDEEEVKLTLVSATDKMVPHAGSCTSCDGTPIISESKHFQLNKNKQGETIVKVRGGILELSKFQIGCCSGARGHGCPFLLKAEIVTENSPLKGRVSYSLPIDVGAKGPFAKVFQNSKLPVTATETTSPEPVTVNVPVTENRLVKYQIPEDSSYPGAEEMVQLLHKLNLSQYISLFLEQEVDIQAFLQLTEEDLIKIGISKVGPRVKIIKEISRIKMENSVNIPTTTNTIVPIVPAITDSAPVSLPVIDMGNTIIGNSNSGNAMNSSSLSSPLLASLFQDESGLSENPLKRRKLLESYPSTNSLSELDFEKNVSIYLYLSNIVTSNNTLKKTLFMIKSELNNKDTEFIVNQIQSQVVNDLLQKGKYVFHEGKAQIMIMMQPDKNGDWVAKSNTSDNIWSFKRGDYIKIDNHHNVDISINVHYYYISEKNNNGQIEKSFVEDFRSPKKFPTLFPGGSLEIGVDENRDGRLALAAELDFEPSETFAVTKNGKLVLPLSMSDPNLLTETCNFSFKRRKGVDMKKAESFDDFQKEIFLSKCFAEPSMF